MYLTPRRYRFLLNTVFGPYWGTGVKIVSVAADWTRMHVRMRLGLFNRNAVGTHFGGSLYAMVDPHCMIMLMNSLGKDYILWDKSAEIEFISPGRGTVHCRIEISREQIEDIRNQADQNDKIYPEFELMITDDEGQPVARVTKRLYVRRKSR